MRPTHTRCITLAQSFLSLVLLISLAACSTALPDTAPTPTVETATEQSSEPEQDETLPIEYAEISFQVEVPENTPPGQPVFINILEEVTGLALSAQANPMEPQDGRIFTTSLQFPLGSVVKYRYSRQTSEAPVEEHTSDGRQVRYRLFNVQGPGAVQDVVSRWTDTSFDGPSGRIMGTTIDSRTKQPIPNLLIASGGSQALTRSDGTFIIEGLPPGTHNLVGYALDGSYRTFQQGALVAPELDHIRRLRPQPCQTGRGGLRNERTGEHHAGCAGTPGWQPVPAGQHFCRSIRRFQQPGIPYAAALPSARQPLYDQPDAACRS